MSTASIDEMELDFDTLDTQLRLFDSYKVGDIILVRSDNGYLSRSYQWLCRSFLRRHPGPKWSAIPSHVLIVVGPGLYMESMPKSGVRFIKAEQCRPNQFQYFKVLRNLDAESFSEKIVDASTWHFGQSYNYKINLTWWRRKFHSHSYCSQLVCSIYERAQKKLPGNPANLALPIDLAKLEFIPGWSDVTRDYLGANKLLDQGYGADIFETHRQLAIYTMQQNYDTADSQKLFHQVYMITKMLNRRTRIRNALAHISTKTAEVYHRLFISAEDTSVDEHKPESLTPQMCVKMLITNIDEFSNVPDIFARANTWRMKDEKFQQQFEKGKAVTTELMYRQALSFAIAAFGLALVLKDGTNENFELYRNQLLQATYISRELFDHVQDVTPKAFETISALINNGDPTAKIWMSAILCFMELTVVSRCLLPESSFADYCENPQVSTLGQGWIDIFNSLSPELKQGILKDREHFLEDLLNRPNIDVDSLDKSDENETR
jgi:hypothetical protein